MVDEKMKEYLKQRGRLSKGGPAKPISPVDEFEQVKKLLAGKQDKFNNPFLIRQLRENATLRKVFLSTVKTTPAKISEIYEASLLTKPTCYTQLHRLMDLDLVTRVYVMDVKSKNMQNPEIEKKFDDWVKSMPEKLKRYYLAKTSYWMVTEFGKQFAMNAYTFEQEFREKEYSKDEKRV